AGSPAYKRFRQRRKPWRKAEFISAAQVKSIGVPGQSAGLAGGIPKGASPLCVVVGGGFLRGRGSRNTLPLKRVFVYFLHEQQVTRVRAGKAREPSNRMAITGEEKCFSPTRPAIGESQRIGAMRWHRAIKARGTGAEPPKRGVGPSAPLH